MKSDLRWINNRTTVVRRLIVGITFSASFLALFSSPHFLRPPPTTTIMNNDFFDFVTTPLNPCSLEVLPEPIELDEDGASIWLLMLACYELQPDDTSRRGQLDLYTPQVPNCLDDMHLSFGKPISILGGDSSKITSGILDGKWLVPSITDAGKILPKRWYYATAHSSGEILVHSIVKTSNEVDVKRNNKPFQIRLAGKTEIPDRRPALCLSLSWDVKSSNHDATRIVSSYSDGHVALHNVALHDNGRVDITSDESWLAHTMFGNPAEVWTCCFSRNDTNVVFSGGDEGAMKVWDIRARPIMRAQQTLKDFDAGITVLSPHPRKPHWIACGSYDETVAIYDLRYLPKPMARSEPWGGGIWRCKWHPYDDNRILLGAMHGGCRVVQILERQVDGHRGVSSHSIEFHKEYEFINHSSMTYGADWLVCKNPENPELYLVEASASCSFYDRALYLWQTK